MQPVEDVQAFIPRSDLLVLKRSRDLCTTYLKNEADIPPLDPQVTGFHRYRSVGGPRGQLKIVR